MNTAVVGVGSNINPQENIAKIREIFFKEHKLLAESKFITTAPIGFKNQPYFVNGAFLIETALNQVQFQSWLKRTETALGRKKERIPSGRGPLIWICWFGMILLSVKIPTSGIL